MDDSEAVTVTKEGVSIFFGDITVGSPTGMADTDGTGVVEAGEGVSETGDFTDTFQGANDIMVEDSDTGRIVAAIFETLEAVDKDFGSRFMTDVADDATHIKASNKNKKKAKVQIRRVGKILHYRLSEV